MQICEQKVHFKTFFQSKYLIYHTFVLILW